MSEMLGKVVGNGEGEGPVIRSTVHPDYLTVAPSPAFQNLSDCFAKGGLSSRRTSPCFGTRAYNADGTRGPYEWISYEQAAATIDALAKAIHAHALAPRNGEGLRMMGFFMKNSADWMLTALACYKTGIVVVPMYDTLGPEV